MHLSSAQRSRAVAFAQMTASTVWSLIVVLTGTMADGRLLSQRRYQCRERTTKEDCIAFNPFCAWWNRMDESGGLCVTWADGDTKPFGSCEAYADYMEAKIFNCLGCAGPQTIVECM